MAEGEDDLFDFSYTLTDMDGSQKVVNPISPDVEARETDAVQRNASQRRASQRSASQRSTSQRSASQRSQSQQSQTQTYNLRSSQRSNHSSQEKIHADKDEINKYLLEQIAEHPVLFDTGRKDYRNKRKSAQAWASIRQSLENRYLVHSLELAQIGSADQNILIGRLESLKTSYRRHKKAQPKSGSGAGQAKRPYKFAGELDAIERRKTKNGVQPISSSSKRKKKSGTTLNCTSQQPTTSGREADLGGENLVHSVSPNISPLKINSPVPPVYLGKRNRSAAQIRLSKDSRENKSEYVAAKLRAYEALERSCSKNDMVNPSPISTKFNECLAHSTSLAHSLNKLPPLPNFAIGRRVSNSHPGHFGSTGLWFPL